VPPLVAVAVPLEVSRIKHADVDRAGVPRQADAELGREDANLRFTESKSTILRIAHLPSRTCLFVVMDSGHAGIARVPE
jgi:hypothetical protein